jgi:hypothetical protein
MNPTINQTINQVCILCMYVIMNKYYFLYHTKTKKQIQTIQIQTIPETIQKETQKTIQNQTRKKPTP